jgi:hypothetical protein
MPTLLERYVAGEHEQVWKELAELGPLVRRPEHFQGAYAVAQETMRRARSNIETLRGRLTTLGYEFANGGEVHVQPEPDIEERINALEGKVGPLPLSLRAFYEIVGSVDFCQSPAQLKIGRLQEQEAGQQARTPESELLELGAFDPLEVRPFSGVEAKVPGLDGRIYYCFASDEFHKADYSGGENYHVWIPDHNVDFPIRGMYNIDELFVVYLRTTFQNGGFRGKCEADEDKAWKVLPDLKLTRELAAGLLLL